LITPFFLQNLFFVYFHAYFSGKMINILKMLKIWGFLALILIGCSQTSDRNLTQSKQSPSPDPVDLLAEKNEQRSAVLPYIYKNADKTNLCEGELDKSASEQFSSVYPIDHNRYLVQLLCFMGAYQGNYRYFIYEKQADSGSVSVKPLGLERYEPDDSGKISQTLEDNVGGSPDYNSGQKILSVMTKYRGLGDCGSLAHYQWDSNQFKVVEYRVKEKCDGKYVEPEQYAQVYPLK
jgi:hypothetical protein